MTYQVLARKYRPQRFSDVAGQEHVTRTLLNALSQGRTAHGYIFSGHRGIGKTTIARILAQALNCRRDIGSPERPTPEPCGVCESCTEIRQGNAVDVIEIDAATNRGIDEIRELRDAARYRPARDKFKIYILDEAHQITDAAFNALLKTLEEPPDHIVFMMATTQAEDIPQTIRSRCQHFSFHAVKFEDILAQLRAIATAENIDAEDAALALLAEAGDGSMRDALSIMDQAIASAPLENGRPKLDAEQIRELMGTVPNTVFERLLEAISEGQTAVAIDELNRLLNAGNSPAALARQFVKYLRNALMVRIAGENTELLQVSADERARAARSAVLYSEEDLTRFLQVMLRTFDELNYRQEQRFHLELGLVKLVHLQRLLPVEEFLSQFPPGTLPGGGTKTAAPVSSRAALPVSSRSAASDSVRSASSASPGSAAPVRAAATAPAGLPVRASVVREPEGQKPAYSPFGDSPFEADRNRKISGESVAAPVSAAPLPSLRSAAPEPRALTPLEAMVRVAEPVPVKASATVGVAEAVSDATEGALALAVETEEDATEETMAPEQPMAASGDLDGIREAVCAALEREGHNTAAALLESGNWTEANGTIQVEVGIKKTMLGLTMNAEAEKICRNAMRDVGAVQKLVFVPGEGGAAKAAKPRAAASGSVQAAAMENPLVRQAQELFQAEVRSVLDLRDKG
jgi:DNA polymerase-3 subunit gamma/tau